MQADLVAFFVFIRIRAARNHLVNQAEFLRFVRSVEAITVERLTNLIDRLPGMPGVDFIQPLADFQNFLGVDLDICRLALEAAGLPRELFTLAFAMGRVLGWTAHIFEQEQTGRIIRPASRYTGPVPKGETLVAIAG